MARKARRKRGPGAPKGNRNNPDGRPEVVGVGGGKGERIGALVTPDTAKRLDRLAAAWKVSKAEVLRRLIEEAKL